MVPRCPQILKWSVYLTELAVGLIKIGRALSWDLYVTGSLLRLLGRFGYLVSVTETHWIDCHITLPLPVIGLSFKSVYLKP